MAVNGIELAIGQAWRTRDGELVHIASHWSTATYAWKISGGGSVNDKGERYTDTVNPGDLVDLVQMDDAIKASPMTSKLEWDAAWRGNPSGARLRAPAVSGVGDINSTAKGSGARYNTGKAPFDLVPLFLVAKWHRMEVDLDDAKSIAISALELLSSFQERSPTSTLILMLTVLGDGWAECAQVLEYGKKKYAAHNWCKGMAWSIPIACAARHLLAMINGEVNDPESGLPHRGHVFANICMLMTFEKTFPEGDDRAPAGYLAPVAA
jgi:hypothetical protein